MRKAVKKRRSLIVSTMLYWNKRAKKKRKDYGYRSFRIVEDKLIREILISSASTIDHTNHEEGYSEKWDARYCDTCNIWLDPPCGCGPEDNIERIECHFECWKRPEKPLEEKNHE